MFANLWAKVKPLLNNVWAYIIGIFGILILIVGYERREKLEAEAQVITADDKEKDAVLQRQQTDVQQEIVEAQQEAKKQEAHQLTPDEAQKVLEDL